MHRKRLHEIYLKFDGLREEDKIIRMLLYRNYSGILKKKIFRQRKKRVNCTKKIKNRAKRWRKREEAGIKQQHMIIR